MAHHKHDEPPAYTGYPQQPQPAYGGYHDPYQQPAHHPGAYAQNPQMGYYAQQTPYPQHAQYPQQGYYGPQHHASHGHYHQQRGSRPGVLHGLLAALACCCCLDCMF